MDSSGCIGLMAVVAVSSSVALVACRAQQHLTREFMKKVESEMGEGRLGQQKNKKVRFAADVVEPSSNNKEYRMRRSRVSI